MDTDEDNNPTCIYCVYDETGEITKTKTAIHWVSEPHMQNIAFRDYSRLFTIQSPGSLGTIDELREALNPNSVMISTGYVEDPFAEYDGELPVQFERHGFYCTDRSDSAENSDDKLIVNLTVPLKVTKAAF